MNPPKQIAMHHCDQCGHLTFADDVNQLDQIKKRTCDECDFDETTVHLYRYEKPARPR